MTLVSLDEQVKKGEDLLLVGNVEEGRRVLQFSINQATTQGYSMLKQTLERVAQAYFSHSLYRDAEFVVMRLVQTDVQMVGEKHATTALHLEKLARIYQLSGQEQKYVDTLKRLVKIQEDLNGIQHETTVKTLEKLVTVLTELGKPSEAAELQEKLRSAKKTTREIQIQTTGANGTPLVAKRTVFLGQVLMRSGLVAYAALNKQIEAAKKEGVPVGQKLVEQELISKDELQAALTMQSAVRDEHLTMEQAGQCLGYIREKKVSLETALAELNFAHLINSKPSVKLGDLLIQSGLLTNDAFEQALNYAKDAGIQLGKMLVEGGYLDEVTVAKALALQDEVRQKKVTFDQAIKDLQS